MVLFPRKKQKEPESYDRESLRPVIRVSICTGERVAGFREKNSGRFREVQLIRSDCDLREFMERYGISEIPPEEY